jgi:homeobox-leucine zipper protein
MRACVLRAHRAAAVVLQLLKVKDRLAEAEEEKTKLIAAAAGGAGSSSPSSSSSFSTVTTTTQQHHTAALVGQFGVEPEEEAADLITYMSEYAYNSYMNMMDLAPGYFGGVVYDHFN